MGKKDYLSVNFNAIILLTMSNNNFYCVIMAGGTGRRFWPYSRKALPKQFLDFFGSGQTLIQQTYERYKRIILPENIYISTHKDYKEIVLEMLPEMDESRLIVEEEHRNTAPAIAYASHVIQKINPDATVIIAPSDNVILKPEEFRQGFQMENCSLPFSRAIEPVRMTCLSPYGRTISSRFSSCVTELSI